jgi:predicted DNA-binding transcriptional regulator YafY
MHNRHFARYQRIDSIIRSRTSGSPKSFSKKLNISISTLYKVLAEMKEMGAPIAYCRETNSYYYEEEGFFAIGFVAEGSFQARQS